MRGLNAYWTRPPVWIALKSPSGNRTASRVRSAPRIRCPPEPPGGVEAQLLVGTGIEITPTIERIQVQRAPARGREVHLAAGVPVPPRRNHDAGKDVERIDRRVEKSLHIDLELVARLKDHPERAQSDFSRLPVAASGETALFARNDVPIRKCEIELANAEDPWPGREVDMAGCFLDTSATNESQGWRVSRLHTPQRGEHVEEVVGIVRSCPPGQRHAGDPWSTGTRDPE